jgi:hypothetical protein
MSQNIIHRILVTFEISGLATSVWVRCWGKVDPGYPRVSELLAGLGLGLLRLRLGWLGKVWLSSKS